MTRYSVHSTPPICALFTRSTKLQLCFVVLFIGLVGGCNNNLQEAIAIPEPADLAQLSDSRLVQAVEVAQKAVAESPKSAESWGHLGNVYVIHGWHAEAAQCYHRAIEIAPEEFRWFYYLGRSLEEFDPAASAVALARAIALDAKYAPAYLFYAYALMKLERFEEAQRHLERTAELDPLNPFAMLRLGQRALAGKRFNAARDYLQQALTLNPEQSEARAALAQVYLALGDSETASRHAQAARNPTKHAPMRDPEWGKVQLAGATSRWIAQRGQFYLQSRDFKRAVAELSQITDEQKDPKFWLSYGTALLAVNRYQGAVTAFEQALKYSRDNDLSKLTSEDRENIYINLGLAYIQVGNAQQAKKFLQEALTLYPESVEAMNKLAFLYYQQGQVPNAIHILQRAREVESNPLTLRMLVALLRETGDLIAAREVENELRQILPKHSQ